ncbi:uncharacterized protein MONBRDRAFT_10944 [Monosiga brevicollis MX1]|uniref:Uncharacterized protein n=1 Tax=Monosiga brevicollis TaxID=81824 RepID=A9V7Q5_MONBE|nr:uncharacterized protein MONBRDRAFT_10944 [Monosiga brevicollis MX1]EDQ86415.1 predicted protein [Monosiga brevicollis MX1]|eukprot:XP_001748805.1 hypothetical protein [Monosiga brevicollis MX1]
MEASVALLRKHLVLKAFMSSKNYDTLEKATIRRLAVKKYWAVFEQVLLRLLDSTRPDQYDWAWRLASVIAAEQASRISLRDFETIRPRIVATFRGQHLPAALHDMDRFRSLFAFHSLAAIHEAVEAMEDAAQSPLVEAYQSAMRARKQRPLPFNVALQCTLAYNTSCERTYRDIVELMGLVVSEVVVSACVASIEDAVATAFKPLVLWHPWLTMHEYVAWSARHIEAYQGKGVGHFLAPRLRAEPDCPPRIAAFVDGTVYPIFRPSGRNRNQRVNYDGNHRVCTVVVLISALG